MHLPKTLTLLLLMLPVFAFGQPQQEREISDLKTKIITLSNSFQSTLNKNQLNNNSMLAHYQARLLIKVFTYEIYLKMKKSGVKRNQEDIEAMVQAAFNNAWIFQDLGKDHADRFLLILQWAKDESNYDKNCKSSWKKGQYIRSLNKTINFDSTDYGAWQNNDANLQFLKIVNYLYESGVVTFKVKKIRTVKDLLDIPTSCTARCLIESDRRNRGWEWKHVRDKKYNIWLHATMDKLEHDGLYSKAFVEKYYNITPYKRYSNAKRAR